MDSGKSEKKKQQNYSISGRPTQLVTEKCAMIDGRSVEIINIFLLLDEGGDSI